MSTMITPNKYYSRLSFENRIACSDANLRSLSSCGECALELVVIAVFRPAICRSTEDCANYVISLHQPATPAPTAEGVRHPPSLYHSHPNASKCIAQIIILCSSRLMAFLAHAQPCCPAAPPCTVGGCEQSGHNQKSQARNVKTRETSKPEHVSLIHPTRLVSTGRTYNYYYCVVQICLNELSRNYNLLYYTVTKLLLRLLCLTIV